MRISHFLSVLLAATSGIPQTAAAVLPTAPLEYVDTALDPTYNRPADITVAAGGNLQLALDQAQPGQIVELEAGATFTGNFKLPNNAGSAWIYIRSSRYQELPPEGSRIGPEHASLMPKIVTPDAEPALITVFGSHHFRLLGIEISTGVYNYNLVILGSGMPNYSDPIWMRQRATSAAQLPHHIIFDRCYFHSTSDTNPARRGILADGKYIAIIGSHLANFKDVSDAQAISVWQGQGPYKFVNNYIEATAENILFGGEDILIPNLVPADIEIRGNHVHKRWDWFGPPDLWTIKNLLELKAAERVLISGNVFENTWRDGQIGKAILFTPRNQYGDDPWVFVRDVTFEHNIIRHTGVGMAISGDDNTHPSEQTQRVLIRNNLFADVSKLYQPLSTFLMIDPAPTGTPILDLTIDHNLFLFSRSEVGYESIGVYSTTSVDNFVFENNILEHGDYGPRNITNLVGTWSFAGNAIVRAPGERSYAHYATQANFEASYGTQNFNVDGLAAVGFTDFNGGNYRLAPSSPYANAATDGTDVGLDVDALYANIFLYCDFPLEQLIEDQQVILPTSFAACMNLTVGQNSSVAPSGDLTLRAGEWIVLGEGFVVEQGGQLSVKIEPPYPD